jgi:hypothetical protein
MPTGAIHLRVLMTLCPGLAMGMMQLHDFISRSEVERLVTCRRNSCCVLKVWFEGMLSVADKFWVIFLLSSSTWWAAWPPDVLL